MGGYLSASTGTGDAEDTTHPEGYEAFWGRVEDSPRVNSAIEVGTTGISGPSYDWVEDNTQFEGTNAGFQNEDGESPYEVGVGGLEDAWNEHTPDIPDPSGFSVPWWVWALLIVAVLALLSDYAALGASALDR